MSKKTKKTGTTSAAELDVGPIGHLAPYLISIAHGLSLQTFVRMVGEPSRNARYIILSLIRQNPGVTQTQLSATRFRDKSSMSPVIAEFIADGLVRREKVYLNDRPSQALYLTEKGEKQWEILHVVAVEFMNHISRIMGPEDHAQLERLLEKLVQGLIALDEDLKRQD